MELQTGVEVGEDSGAWNVLRADVGYGAKSYGPNRVKYVVEAGFKGSMV